MQQLPLAPIEASIRSYLESNSSCELPRELKGTPMELIHGRPQAGARGCACISLDDLKKFLQRCAIAVIKINAGNAGIKSHNNEV